MSQRALAEVVGVTQGAVAQWEGSGDTKTSPSLDKLGRVVVALGISMERFYGPLPRRNAS